MNFYFEFLQELLMLWEAISITRKSFSSDIKTLWSLVKETQLASRFSTHFSVFDLWRNTLPCVWCITYNTLPKYCTSFTYQLHNKLSGKERRTGQLQKAEVGNQTVALREKNEILKVIVAWKQIQNQQVKATVRILQVGENWKMIIVNTCGYW